MSGEGSPTTYWQSLAVAADEGHLYLDPESAAACLSACDEYISRLVRQQEKAKELANVSGWGDFASGQQLQKIFSEKAVGGDNNMVDVLQSHIDVVEEMKVVFSKFFSATQATDEANAAHVQAQGPK